MRTRASAIPRRPWDWSHGLPAAPLQLATAEGGRAIVGLAKSLLAPLGVRHLEFYRPPADAPDGDPDLPPPLLLLLPEDGLYVCAVPCGGGGGEVDRAFDATGPRSLLVTRAPVGGLTAIHDGQRLPRDVL